jgi:hypothetical protein
MQRWLKDEPALLPIETNTPSKERAEDLACLNQLPADASNFRIQNELTRPVSLKAPGSRAAWERRRAELKTALSDKVFHWFPTGPIPFETKAAKSGGGYASRYAHYKEVSFQSEPGVRVRARLFLPKRGAASAPLLIYVKRPGDSFYFMDVDELLPLLDRWTVLAFNPRFTEASISGAEYTDIERTAAWVGRTIAAMQVWDITRAVKWAIEEEKLPGSSLVLYGKGDMGVLGLYAALFEPRIEEVILSDPPASHWQKPALLNVLRVTDIPEVAAAFAPRRLVSLSELPGTFDYTRRVYRMKSAADQFVRSASLPEALAVWNERPLEPARRR